MSKTPDRAPRHYYRIREDHSIEDIFNWVAPSARQTPRGLGLRINGDLVGTVDQENVKQAFAIESEDGLSQLLGHIVLAMTAKTPWPFHGDEAFEDPDFIDHLIQIN